MQLADRWTPGHDLAVLCIAVGAADAPISRPELDATARVVAILFPDLPDDRDELIAHALEHWLVRLTAGVGDSPDGWLVRHATAVREALGDTRLQEAVVQLARVARAGELTYAEVQTAAGFASFWERPDLARAMLKQFSRAQG
ncbi:MAG: hypothetical protein H6742_10270 [Alphaproteobacteria bacterium]|nr:hypothetical protein [Alphaproteobacteria bacterium]